MFNARRGGRLQKAVGAMLEAGVKRGFLNPEYMRPAWRAELDQVQGFVKKKKKKTLNFQYFKTF